MIYYCTGHSGFIASVISKRHECYPIERGALKSRELLREALGGTTATVINCGAYGNYSYQADRNMTWAVNVGNVMNLCYEAQKLINISSSSVLIDHDSDYALSKHSAERIVEYFGHISVRPSSVTGIGEQKNHLIPTLIRSCLYGEEMRFVAHPTHDFIDVEDLVTAIEIIDEKAKDGDIYNVSSGITITNQEVKNLVEKIIGKKANTVEVKKMRVYDNENWIVPNEGIRELGWTPKFNLEQTIIKMIEEELR